MILKKRFLVLCLIVLSIAGLTFGRAGGAGRSSSSSSSHRSSSHSSSSHRSSSSRSSSSSSHSSSSTSSDNSAAIVIIIFFGAILFIAVAGKFTNQGNSAPLLSDEIFTSDAMVEFLNRKDFNEEEFKTKVKTAFINIQNAWSKKDLSSVRRFISDGVYQRFTTQFKMMDLLKQTNTINNPLIETMDLIDAQSDLTTDTIHVRISAMIDDEFICSLDHNLDNAGESKFVEYWSFTRKKNNKNCDIFSSNNCPSCGSPLPSISDVCTCPHCGALVNSGEYDWVLSEITQNDDWAMSARLNSSPEYVKNMKTFSNTCDFSIQVAEDKASNGYMQILAAFSTHDHSRLRRFVTDSLYKKLIARIAEESTVFNELFLNEVKLMSSRIEGKRTIISVGVTVSYQRVKITDNKVKYLDFSRLTKKEFMILERASSDTQSKGSTYVNQCSSCGAPATDSLDNCCSYCGAIYNSGASDWVISDILDTISHTQYFNTYSGEFDFSTEKCKVDNLLSVKEYALNNILVMIAADGHIDEKELAYTSKIAKRLGINESTLPPLLDMANDGRLSIRTPDDPVKCESIRKLMLRAAEVDQNFSEKEMEIIRQFDRLIAQKTASETVLS